MYALYDRGPIVRRAKAIFRNLKIWGRRRWPKRRLKSEVAFFQFSSLSLPLTYFVKYRRTLLEFNSLEQFSSSKKERKFCRRLFTSSIKREVRKFHVVVEQCSQRNVQKNVKIVVLLIKPIAFLKFSLPSPSSDLKVPFIGYPAGASVEERELMIR